MPGGMGCQSCVSARPISQTWEAGLGRPTLQRTRRSMYGCSSNRVPIPKALQDWGGWGEWYLTRWARMRPPVWATFQVAYARVEPNRNGSLLVRGGSRGGQAQRGAKERDEGEDCSFDMCYHKYISMYIYIYILLSFICQKECGGSTPDMLCFIRQKGMGGGVAKTRKVSSVENIWGGGVAKTRKDIHMFIWLY